MKKIKLFLVATENDLAEDRMAVADLLRILNEKYEDKELYFQLVKPKAVPTEKEISKSELVFILWFHHSDEITAKSFENALSVFQKSGRPKIITYFKQSDGVDIADDVGGFMERLDKELGHYYNLYEHIDSLRFSLIMQISALESSISLECKNGDVLLEGEKYLSLYDVPCAAGNKALGDLKPALKNATAKFFELRELHADDENDEAITQQYMDASERRRTLREQVAEVEKNILAAALSMAKDVASGMLSDRQKEAYRLFEKGDYEGANAVLNFDEICADIASAEQVANLASSRLQNGVSELLQKIAVIKAKSLTRSDYAEIEACFEEAVRVEQQHNLPKTATEQYLQWKILHHENEEALALGEKLVLYRKLENSPVDTIELYLAQLYYKTGQHIKAEQLAKALLSNLQSTALIHLNSAIILCHIYLDIGKLDEVKQLKKQLNVLCNMKTNKLTLREAKELFLLRADISYEQGDYMAAKKWITKGIAHLEKNMTADMDSGPALLVESKLALGEFYYGLGFFLEAQQILHETGQQAQELMNDDVIMYGEILAKIKLSLSLVANGFCYAQRAYDESCDAIKLLLPLCERSEETYQILFAQCMCQNAQSLFDLGMNEMANQRLQLAIEITQEQLDDGASKNRGRFIDLALQLGRITTIHAIENQDDIKKIITCAKAMSEEDMNKGVRFISRAADVQQMYAAYYSTFEDISTAHERICNVIEIYESTLKCAGFVFFRNSYKAYRQLAHILMLTKDYDLALTHLSTALSITEIILHPGRDLYPSEAYVLMDLYSLKGNCHYARGEFQETYNCFKEVKNLFLEIPTKMREDSLPLMQLYFWSAHMAAIASCEIDDTIDAMAAAMTFTTFISNSPVMTNPDRIAFAGAMMDLVVDAWKSFIPRAEEGNPRIILYRLLKILIHTLEENEQICCDSKQEDRVNYLKNLLE